MCCRSISICACRSISMYTFRGISICTCRCISICTLHLGVKRTILACINATLWLEYMHSVALLYW